MLNSSFPPILMQEQPVLAPPYTAEDYLGPTHLERALLTAATVYTGCSLCVHSTYANV